MFLNVIIKKKSHLFDFVTLRKQFAVITSHSLISVGHNSSRQRINYVYPHYHKTVLICETESGRVRKTLPHCHSEARGAKMPLLI